MVCLLGREYKIIYISLCFVFVELLVFCRVGIDLGFYMFFYFLYVFEEDRDRMSCVN